MNINILNHPKKNAVLEVEIHLNETAILLKSSNNQNTVLRFILDSQMNKKF